MGSPNTSPASPFAGRTGTSTGPSLGSSPPAATGPFSVPTALGNVRPSASFPTLSPPPMKTLVYAPNVQILIAHNGIEIDVSKDIVRGQIVRRENSVSSLFFTLSNHDLKYTSNHPFGRMDRVVCYLTRTQPVQVFSGYLDDIPWIQAYPGTVDFRASCTLKRLQHTWWNPALPASLQFFQQGPGFSQQVAGDGQGGAATDSGIGSILRSIMEKVGGWTPESLHIENFPQEFITFANNYLASTNMVAHNAEIANKFNALILGDDTAPGTLGAAVGYQAGDPIGTAATVTNSTTQFYLSQIITACDQRGMGPQVTDTANSQQVQQVANTLETVAADGGMSPSGQKMAQDVHTAGQQLSQYSSNWSTQNSQSDAAILALACVMVSSGNGTPAIQMQANNADPPTLTFWHDGVSTNGTSAGLFQQPNNGAWGTPEQRMNPLSSAGMFFDKLNAMTGWRNMDPGQAIWQVQQSQASTVALYDAAIPVAQKLVAAYRQAQQGATNAANAAGGLPTGGAANVLGGGANPTASVAGNALNVATSSPVPAAAGALAAGGPNPNSEGAINAATAYLPTPYLYGGNTPYVGLDCSALVQRSFASIGINLPRDTYGQKAAIPSVPLSSIQRGDVLQTNYGGHTGIYLGGGQWIQTGGPDGVPGSIQPVPTGPGGVNWAGRVCGNQGPNPGSPWTPSAGPPAGTGTPPGVGTGVGVGAGGGDGTEPIARDLFSYIFAPGAYASAASAFFTQEKAYIDDQPLIQMIVAMCQASLRSFQSAPNGDFIAYYPDHFGLHGKPAVLNLEDIELKDVHINLSDDNLTTHVYIDGDYNMMGQADQVTGWLLTCGVATVQNQWLYNSLIQSAPSDIEPGMSAELLLKKFGVRPYKNTYEMAGNAGLEFLLACQIFMGKWAAQYETDIGLTFMPELYPGQRLLINKHNLTVYCSAVTHEFDWEHGFKTMATVSAAGNPQSAAAIYSSLPGFLNHTSTNQNPSGNANYAAADPNGPIFNSPYGGGNPSSSPFGNGGVPVGSGGAPLQ